MPDTIGPFANARELNLADAKLNGPWPALYRLIEAYERLHIENERLRVALLQIANIDWSTADGAVDMRRIAMIALDR